MAKPLSFRNLRTNDFDVSAGESLVGSLRVPTELFDEILYNDAWQDLEINVTIVEIMAVLRSVE